MCNIMYHITAHMRNNTQHASNAGPVGARGTARTPDEVAGVFDSREPEADAMQDTRGTAPQTQDAPDRLSDDPQTPAPPVIDECPF